MAFSRKFIINLFQFVGVEGFVTAIVDVFGSTLRKGYRKEIFIAVSCFVMYLVGLSMVAEASLLHIYYVSDIMQTQKVIVYDPKFEGCRHRTSQKVARH